jgi:hypothetical protein
MINNDPEARPLRTIVLFVFLHGEETLNVPLDVPISNTLINPSGKLGLCVYSKELHKSDYTLDIVNYYKTLLKESRTINDFNYIMSNMFSNTNMHYPPKKSLEKLHKQNFDYFSKEYEFSRTDTSNYVRNYTYDKMYTFNNDEFNNNMGIYILGTKHVSDEINSVLTEPLIDFNTSSPESILNAYNITNKNVYFNMIYNFVSRFGFFDVENSNLSNDVDNTSGRNRFNNILLSRILRLFYNMGFEHVDIVEMSCRYIKDEEYMESYPLIRKHSFDEKQNYKRWSEKNVNTGGKQNKKSKTKNKKNNKKLKNKKTKNKKLKTQKQR